jgi:capsular exopolysaccharide synthesis family protein
MSSHVNGQPGRSRPVDDDALDVRRYVEALRRNRVMIAAIVAVVTITAVAVSLALPKTYEATARIVVDAGSALGTTDTASVERELATTQTLATTAPVLAEAARAVPGETRQTLAGRVTSSVDPAANIIRITVSADTAPEAATLANAVAEAFLDRQARVVRDRNARAVAALNEQIAALRSRPATDADVAAELAALKSRVAELTVASASAGSELQLVQRPDPPAGASSPRPFRNGVIALFASLFLALLVALGRDQLKPRVSSQRELAQLLELPVLSGIPHVPKRMSARDARAEHETYQTLSAAVRLALPPGQRSHVILVTSALHAEGKTTVTTRLARLLSQAGHRTLVVSGDLRWPKLDDTFDVAGRRGLRDLLAGDPDAGRGSELRDLVVPVGADGANRRAALDVLPAGGRTGDASRLLTADTLESVFDELRGLGYPYVLVDSPPLLGVADTQILARLCDHLLLVSRLERLTMSSVLDLREVLDRVDIEPLGLVVLGARLVDSPYFAAEDHTPAAPLPARAAARG